MNASRRGSTGGDLAVSLTVLALGALVPLVRPPLPIDETRYLEVFRESLAEGPWLLRLMGEPYAEKPPLLFWLGRGFTWLGCSPEPALRAIPALATALTVFFVARIGRRAGSRLAGAMQAALLLPLLAGQFLLFDSLLAACVWGGLLAWTRGRDRSAFLGLALALLAKGPVALLFFLPMAWALQPLRAEPCPRGRAAMGILLALLPLAAWALGAAALGGPEFARALLWDHWAGRVTRSFAHERPFWFYVPLAIVGALPVTLVGARALRRPASGWERRTVWALLLQLVAFTAISGKQAHYLIPAAPALALVLAAALESGRIRVRMLHVGVQVEILLLALTLVVAGFALGRFEGSFAERGQVYLRSGAWVWPWLCAALALGAGSLLALRWRASASRLLVTALLSTGVCLVSLQSAAGHLLFPHQLAEVLESNPSTPLAFLGTSHHGLYCLLARRQTLTRLDDRAELGPWGSSHPGGIVVLEGRFLADGPPAGFDLVARDVVHRCDVFVLRATRAGAPGAAPEPGQDPERGAHAAKKAVLRDRIPGRRA